jgi:hypothetical protein
MTERWRKKLGDLDKQGPSDDVFERAKHGPARADEPLPGMRTSTRVVTIVAAFAIFALGISAFAIPALRMNGAGPPTTGAGASLMPLWPTQSPDQLDALQASADAGNADWALSPTDVAARFGQQVMGWPDAVAQRNVDESHCFMPQGASIAPVPCSQLSVGGYSVPAGVPPEFASSTPSSIAGPFTWVALYQCGVRCAELSPAEWVHVYQPLDQGPGGVWAILQAQGEASVSVNVGQVVHDGASISGNFYGVGNGGVVPTLGYGGCGQAAASSTFDRTSSVADVGVVRLDVSLAGCTGAQPGYVWAAFATVPLAGTGSSMDPITGEVAPGTLASLTAASVTLMFPDGGGVAAPATGATTASSPPSVSWTSYTDPYGWTIDVPKLWTAHDLTTQGPGTQGAEFVGDSMSVRVTTETAPKGSPPPGLSLPTQPDSSFALDATALLQSKDGGLEGEFRGDGLLFSVRVSSPALPGQLSATDQAILDRMIGSITFQPWHVGEVRHDWVAIATPTEDISWITIEGGLYMLFRSADGYELYGSISCAGSDPTKTTATSDGFAKLTCPDGSTWEMDAGGASGGGGDAATNDPPPQWAVTTAHDGTLIAWVLPGVFPEGTGGSPSP